MAQFMCTKGGVLCKHWGTEKPNMSCLICHGWESPTETISAEEKELLDLAKTLGKEGLEKLKKLIE